MVRQMRRPGAGSGPPNLDRVRRLVAQDQRAMSEAVHRTVNRFLTGRLEGVWFQPRSADHEFLG